VHTVVREQGAARGWAKITFGLSALVLSAGMSPLPAAAQSVTGAARVTTYVDACVPIELDTFHRVLAIELGTSIEYSPDAAQASDGTMVRVGCNASGIELSLVDDVTHKAMQRSVELPEVAPAARARLLALAVAEFVVASWVELRLAEPPPVPPVGPPTPPSAAAAARKVAAKKLPPPSAADEYSAVWQLGVSFDAIAFTRGTDLIPQLSLRLDERPLRHLALGLLLGVGHNEWGVQTIGAAPLTTTTGRVSFSYVGQLGEFDVLIGACARFGIVHMAGHTSLSNYRGFEFFAPWGGPGLQLSAAYRAGDHVRVLFELEGGYVTLPAQAVVQSGGVVAELGGLYGSAAVGLGWSF
jgi:hypothetical protein